MHDINCSFCDIRLANLPFIELHCYLDFARPWTTFNALEVKKNKQIKETGEILSKNIEQYK